MTEQSAQTAAASDYQNTSVIPRFTIDGCVIEYENVLVSDRERVFARAEEHAKVYRDLGFDAEFSQHGSEDATLTVKFRGRQRSAALREIFKGMIMATGRWPDGARTTVTLPSR